MSQNPYDQQNNPFGQQQQQSPFGQQPGGFGQQQQGGFGFGGPSGFNDPVQPQKKGGRGRTCFILILLVFACCLLCVGGTVIAAFQYKPAVPALAWVAVVQSDGAENTANVVCEGSQAEAYSLAFSVTYDNVTAFNFDDTFEVDKENNVVTMAGTFTNAGAEVPFSLVMTIDPDNGQGPLGSFGCVESIIGEPAFTGLSGN